MPSGVQTLLSVADLILGPDAESFFAHVSATLNQADVVVGQLEVPHTSRHPGTVSLGRDTGVLSALISAGFDVVTLAGNHIVDAGTTGIEDTIAWLRDHGIAYTGAGMNIDEAKQAAIMERDGTRFGFLSYNCVGPKETWASWNRPGNAYVHVITHYELDHATPGGPPTIYTWAEPNTLGSMQDDIRKLRPLCDVLTVSLHKGIVHTPVKLAYYEHQVSYAAIDAGADVIFGHHAHILKGIEVYKGKAIFHGLCNFVAFLPSLAPKPGQSESDWARRRIELFGFLPDPDYPTYPFHPEAKYTMIAKCAVEDKKLVQASYIPCLINKEGKPEIVQKEGMGREVFDYVTRITREARLSTNFQWEGNEVLIS